MRGYIGKFLTILLLVGGFLVIVPSDVNAQVCDPTQCDCGFLSCLCTGDCPPAADDPVDPWTCFAAGTKVRMADPTSPTASLGARSSFTDGFGGTQQKNIEEVVVGDKVVSQDEMGNKSVSTVTELDQPIRDHMCRVDFVEGHELKMTTEHPIMTTTGWKSITPSATAAENPDLIVASLAIGDKVVKEEGEPGEVKNISCWSAKTPAYNLILDGNVNTYFADGYLAHNKGTCELTLPGCPIGSIPGPTVVSTLCTPKSVCLLVDERWVSAANCNFRQVCTGFNYNSTRECDTYYDRRYDDYGCVLVCTPVAPSGMSLQSPTDGADSSSTSVSLVWNAPTWGTGCPQNNQYYLYVGTTNPPTDIYYTGGDSVLSQTFVGTRGVTYYWYVRANNGSLSVSSPIRSFTILDNQITGTVFYDANNNCGGSGKSSVTISLDNGATTTTTDVNGNYGFTVNSDPHSLSVVTPTGFSCSSGTGCNVCSATGITVGTPSAIGNNFYLTDLREAWWQTEGAGIYAGGEVRSILPSSSFRLIVAPTGGTAAALVQSSGNLGLGYGSLSDPGWNAKSKYKGKTMGYDYFAAHMGVVRGQEPEWDTNLNQADCTEGEDFCYGTDASTSNWNVTNGQKYVVFVNGDLNIRSNITVGSGGFLAFIVNGDVIVDPTVTQLQGLYVMDNSFITETMSPLDDIQLNVKGSIVAWGSFSLGRDMGVGNNIPAEKFTYRPDLLINMPEKMKVFAMQWQEVVAGSFE